jgi:ribosomal protein S1
VRKYGLESRWYTERCYRYSARRERPIPAKELIDALHLAKAGRIAIINEMDKKCRLSFNCQLSRTELKLLAPRVEVVGANRAMVEQTKQTVMDLVAEVVDGETYTGTVIEIKDFGAIIELLRNKEGILYVSEILTDPTEAVRHPDGNMGFVRQQLKLGQKIDLLVLRWTPYRVV